MVFEYSKEEVSKLAKHPFEPYWPEGKVRVCITGAGGFIASHLAKRLKEEGHHVVACDWKRNEHMSEEMFCHEFHLVDLRVFDNCAKVCAGADHVFNLAAARRADVKRFFYASSACVYPEYKQLDTEVES